MHTTTNQRPLIVHLTYAFDFGGLENLMVERINRLPAEAYRHAVVCLTDSLGFASRITKADVAFYCLHKQPGLSLGTHLALWKLLRALRPTILHTYNLSAIEYAPVAVLAGVPVRISGAHGRDADDPHGRNPKHNFLRRAMRPFYDSMYANSTAMQTWNRDVIGVPEYKSPMLPNGIDTDKFSPRSHLLRGDTSVFPADAIVIGTVGRIQDVKDHATLLSAFIALRERLPQLRERLRLAIIGDGPLLAALRAQAASAGVSHSVWLPGKRSDVPDLLRSFDIFVMSSIAEGTPGSALEAMGTALPVVATNVGGLPEVVAHGVSGTLVPASDPGAMADALATYVTDPVLAARHGSAGRERILNRYSMAAMVSAYQSLYDSLCERKTNIRKPLKSCVE